MLMNHSLGLYGSHYGNSFLFDDNETKNHDELLVKLQSENLKSNPGEFSVYCNNGFQLLEILIERVSGLSYSEFLETCISKPLHLTSTKTPRDSFDRGRLTRSQQRLCKVMSIERECGFLKRQTPLIMVLVGMPSV